MYKKHRDIIEEIYWAYEKKHRNMHKKYIGHTQKNIEI
jgi:hypothetical protein